MGKKVLVLKVGSNTLTRGKWQISRGKIEDIAQQILWLQKEYKVVLVSSGAVATARQHMQLHENNHRPLSFKQALAAIGQPILMKIYQEVFNDLGLQVAQCLLSYGDLNREQSKTNFVNTIEHLWEANYIPVVNENDTVATEEIQFGDNDKLAALTAVILKADLMILASDIEGLYSANPKSNKDAKLIERVNDLEHVMHLAEEKSMSSLGSGGIASKLMAADICIKNNIEMWIVNGQQENFVIETFENNLPHTRFIPPEILS